MERLGAGWAVVVVVGWTVYALLLAIHRLFYHPLAKVPGPRLAALTGWYEAYYELFHSFGGQYTFKIKELHQKYGPIVRISPGDIHIDDPEFFDSIYTSREAFDKPEHLKWRFGSPDALFSTPGHGLHRLRRSSQDQFFAKSRIQRLAPLIQDVADRMCTRLDCDFAGYRKVLNLNNLFTSYIADVTTQYSFNRDFMYLSDENFKSPFVQAIRGFKDIAQPCTQCPWLGQLLSFIPERVAVYLQPAMASVQQFQHDMRHLVREAQNDVKENKSQFADKTIMHGILTSGILEAELTVERLKDQATGLIGAGIASAQWTLTIACYHIIHDRGIWAVLRKELVEVMPDANVAPPLVQLEKLPYLSACVEEAIRLACGQMTRSPRVASRPIPYGAYTIPPGTNISLDTWHMHHNKHIFPDSFAFKPLRWLGNPTAPSGKPLKHYMVSFGKGTRNCLGINLARAEITIGLALLVRRFEFELYETTYDRDVKVVRDVVAPDCHPSSQGVRVLVK
ncbi:cytochrome protein [Setomelanomma holmii]|uniref:Cytochrome protein n=1 Tax=Setomelanomma holmii TaxID=210430 RepID=A0A9P4HI37_9PLEO|nr:cytochrome protein [Setomelanomma holmii]